MRGAFRGGLSAPEEIGGQTSQPGARRRDRGARARTVAPVRDSVVRVRPADFRDLTCEAATAGRMAAQSA